MHFVTRSAAVVMAAGLCVVAHLAAPAVPASASFQEASQEEAKEPAREPVDFRKLKETFPAELAGLKRTEATGQKMAMGEMKFTQAEASYGEEAKTIHIVLTDYANHPEFLGAMSAWQSMEIDSESDSGYEKTLKIEGFPAMETFNKYEGETGDGSMSILVGESIIVQLNASGMTATEFQALRDKLGLKKIAELSKGATTQPADGQ